MYLIKNQKGISAVEMIIGSGLAIGLSMVVLKNMTQQSGEMMKNQQNLAMELTLKQVSDTLKRKSDCDQIVGGLRPDQINSMVVGSDESEGEVDPANNMSEYEYCKKVTREYAENEYYSKKKEFEECIANLKKQMGDDDIKNVGSLTQICGEPPSPTPEEYMQECIKMDNSSNTGSAPNPEMKERTDRMNLDFDADMGGGFELDQVDFKMADAGVGDTPLQVNFEFRRENRVSDRDDIVLKRHITSKVTVMEDGTVECPGYQREEISSAGLEKGCVALGGTFIDATKTCSLTALDPNLASALKTEFCKSLSQGVGNLNGGLCDRITLVGNLQGQNIDPTYVEIRDLGNGGAVQRRTLLGTQNCPSGYLRSINANGDLNCRGVVYP